MALINLDELDQDVNGVCQQGVDIDHETSYKFKVINL